MAEPTKKITKIGKQEEFELKDDDGKLIKKYTFQFPGIRKTQELIDKAKNVAGVVVTKDYNEALMQHIIVEPKTDWDYWDDNEGYTRVMDAADRFLGKMLH